MKCAEWLGNPSGGGARVMPSRRKSVSMSRRLKLWAARGEAAAIRSVASRTRSERIHILPETWATQAYGEDGARSRFNARNPALECTIGGCEEWPGFRLWS